MTEQTRSKYPRTDSFKRPIVVHLGPLILISGGVFWLIVVDSGPTSFLGVWLIGYAVFNWFWGTRFAWRTWWDNRTHNADSSETHLEPEFHERRVRLAFAHPYVVIQQSFWVMFLMYWATRYPEFLSLHYGVWFYLTVIGIWTLLSLFFRYIGRGELRDFDYVHRFSDKQGKFIDGEGVANRGS